MYIVDCIHSWNKLRHQDRRQLIPSKNNIDVRLQHTKWIAQRGEIFWCLGNGLLTKKKGVGWHLGLVQLTR